MDISDDDCFVHIHATTDTLPPDILPSEPASASSSTPSSSSTDPFSTTIPPTNDSTTDLITYRNALLTPEDEQSVNQILTGPANEDIVIDKYNIPISRKKILCLKDGQLLNDEVINFYMNMLKERDTAICETTQNID
jgi:Ulp1 family protease